MSAKTGYERGSGVAQAESSGIGYPDPDNPMPPGPWDPVIRAAIEQAGRLFRAFDYRPIHSGQWEFGSYSQPYSRSQFGPVPDPWRMGPLWDPLRFQGATYTELNPQPLPPGPIRSLIHSASLAREIVTRAEYLQQSIDAARTSDKTLENNLPRAFVLGFAKGFTESLGAQPRDPWGGFDPFDPDKPPRPNWLQAILIGCLLKSASNFDSTHAELRHAFEEAGSLLIDAGLAKLPGSEIRAH